MCSKQIQNLVLAVGKKQPFADPTKTNLTTDSEESIRNAFEQQSQIPTVVVQGSSSMQQPHGANVKVRGHVSHSSVAHFQLFNLQTASYCYDDITYFSTGGASGPTFSSLLGSYDLNLFYTELKFAPQK